MKALDFRFDPISPYAHLAFETLPEALVGLSYHVRSTTCGGLASSRAAS